MLPSPRTAMIRTRLLGSPRTHRPGLSRPPLHQEAEVTVAVGRRPRIRNGLQQVPKSTMLLMVTIRRIALGRRFVPRFRLVLARTRIGVRTVRISVPCVSSLGMAPRIRHLAPVAPWTGVLVARVARAVRTEKEARGASSARTTRAVHSIEGHARRLTRAVLGPLLVKPLSPRSFPNRLRRSPP